MFFLQLATVAFCLVALSNGQNAKYCGLRFKTEELLGSTTSFSDFNLMVTSTDMNVADSIINRNPITAIQIPNMHGVFSNPPQTIHPPFCTGEFLESGDINGDGRDDLICRDSSSGEITVRMRTMNGYEPSEKFANTEPVFKCIDGMSIGDFDGNGADDFLCYVDDGNKRVSYTIYFNSGCSNKRQKESFRHHHERHRTYHHYAIPRPNYYGCSPNLPRKVKQTGIVPCTDQLQDIYIADIDGDNKDDVICSNSLTGAISYFLSKPISLNAVFSKEQITTIQCQLPDGLFVSDVDADSDADLICVGQLPGSPGNLPRVSYYTPNGFLAMETFYDDCGAAEFCSDATAFFAGVFVGDFNNDNRADVLCRYTPSSSANIQSEIVFSEPV